MKLPLLVWLMVGPVYLALARSPVPSSFPDTKIETPPLALGDAAQHRLKQFQQKAARGPLRDSSALPTRAPRVSRMPVIEPEAHADEAMVHLPDATVDYTLLIKEPDITLER